MNSWVQWFNMGGYSGYVWSAYGCLAGVLMVNLIRVFRQHKATRKRLQRWFKQE